MIVTQAAKCLQILILTTNLVGFIVPLTIDQPTYKFGSPVTSLGLSITQERLIELMKILY